jgi:hypothetical protein
MTEREQLEQALAEVEAIGKRATELLRLFPADDPFKPIAFRTAALCGVIQADLRTRLANK